MLTYQYKHLKKNLPFQKPPFLLVEVKWEMSHGQLTEAECHQLLCSDIGMVQAKVVHLVNSKNTKMQRYIIKDWS